MANLEDLSHHIYHSILIPIHFGKNQGCTLSRIRALHVQRDLGEAALGDVPPGGVSVSEGPAASFEDEASSDLPAPGSEPRDLHPQLGSSFSMACWLQGLEGLFPRPPCCSLWLFIGFYRSNRSGVTSVRSETRSNMARFASRH